MSPFSLCSAERHKRVTHGILDTPTGDLSTQAVVWEAEKCGAPLFHAHERATMTCAHCKGGYATLDNHPADQWVDGCPLCRGTKGLR